MEKVTFPFFLWFLAVYASLAPMELFGEGDLDRWQLHEMAAERGERNVGDFIGEDLAEAVSVSEEVHVPDIATSRQEKPPVSSGSPLPIVPPVPPDPAGSPMENVKAEPEPESQLVKQGWFSKRKKEPTIECLREEAHALAKKGLSYQFGSDDPKSGGLDCSATVQYLYSSLGIEGVPRTSYLQYEWLKNAGTLHEVKGKNATRQLLKKLRPGDLIFWGGTWKSGHKVSHVMVYLGRNPNTGEHFVFGARGKRVEGLLGSGVDVFVLNPDRGNLVGHGRVPGMRNS